MNFISSGKNIILLTTEFEIHWDSPRSHLPIMRRLLWQLIGYNIYIKGQKGLKYRKAPFCFSIFLAENKAHREGHYDEDTSQHNNYWFA